ncbi:uncharacterized protein NEPG_01413 [Nematocida parisii ERTm1]|uniref:uncharacterized protein n=1 Tax=Nematocida parisii (strain ERTm1 / ATCC PRA-289) TaxID=881290 RepID=UPI000264B292|nr:uncharacterized protein NEPG_01413 [Nematocida parisii ERTm1]EIJ93841.1 hypothetical protein NEPG_01413 [Nematocida parisii ERTm1]|eukprot:XP_013059241.1 hypothetical protein NEPG_01413 [Nematocida parisii ERTm1]
MNTTATKACTHCNHRLAHTTKISEGSDNHRHTLCPKCTNIADEYALSQRKLPGDLLLFKQEAFSHLVFNAGYFKMKNTLFIRLVIFLINTLDRIHNTPSVAEIFKAIIPQILELAIVSVFLHRVLNYRKILHITTVFSTLSILKIFLCLSNLPISNTYYQMCNILIVLMTSKAFSTYLIWSNRTILTIIVIARVFAFSLFYTEIQI